MSSFRQTITGKRYNAGGAYNPATGKYVDNGTTTLTIEGSIQPANDKQRANVPEGFDVTSAMAIATDTEMVVSQGDGPRSDELTIYGEVYEAVWIERWQNDVIPHYWVTMARKKIATP
jgi:hypothetical protein